MRHRVLIVVGLAVSGVSTAQQVSFGPMDFSGLMSVSAMQSAAVLNMYTGPQARTSRAGEVAAAAGAGAARSEFQAAPVRTTYTPSPAISSDVKRDFLRRVGRYDSRAGQAVAAQLAQHDARSIYANIVAPFGLRRGDLADSMTAYMLLGWMIANGGADPARNEVAAVRAKVRHDLASLPQLATPANRQRMDEELMYLFVILHAGWQSAQKEGKLDQYSDGVAATFRKQFGRDLRRLQLTTTGFVERG